MSQRGKSEWNQFVQRYYPKVAHLPQTERFGALAALRDRLAAAGQYQKQYSPSYAGGRHASPRHCNRLPAKQCKADRDCSWIKRSPNHRAYCRRQGGFLLPAYKRRSRFAGTQRIPAVYLAAASKVLAPQLAAAAGVPEAPPLVAETPLATLLASGIPEAPPLTSDKDIVAAAVDDAQAGFCSRFSQGDCQKHFRCSWDDAARICRLADKARELAPVSDRAAAFAAERLASQYAAEAPLRAKRWGKEQIYQARQMSPKTAERAARRAAAAAGVVGLGGLFEPASAMRGPGSPKKGGIRFAQSAIAKSCQDYNTVEACRNDAECFYDEDMGCNPRSFARGAALVPRLNPPSSPSKGKRPRRQ